MVQMLPSNLVIVDIQGDKSVVLFKAFSDAEKAGGTYGRPGDV
jgi:hypothetical protein